MQITGGRITLRLPGGTQLDVGTPGEDALHATVTIHDERFFRELAFGGQLGAAEAFLQQLWSADDLVTLIRIFSRNLDRHSVIESWWSRLAMGGMRLLHWMSRNTKHGSRKNIAAHYDLSNDFFKLFLDPTMMYSSALFDGVASELNTELTDDPDRVVLELEAASIGKIDRACRTLGLRKGDRLIEIGTGWGGLAEHAAINYGCHVTTTTISRQQFDFAKQRIAAAGLNDRVTLLFEDYRDLPARGETFDHLVSIEMIEAVGHKYLPTFFDTCSRLLKPNGRMLVQSITIPDERYEDYCRSVDFIQKYIFPGGHVPSVAAMKDAAGRGGTLRFEDAMEFPLSYARTLRSWRRRFFDHIDEVRQLGFDERFIRMWDYYLCYCEGAFLEEAVGVGHFVWRWEA